MKKTSLYLDDKHLHLLRRIADRERRPQAEIVRDAISFYAAHLPDKELALRRIGRDGTERVRWDGRSIADVPEEELLSGFGRE